MIKYGYPSQYNTEPLNVTNIFCSRNDFFGWGKTEYRIGSDCEVNGIIVIEVKTGNAVS